MRVPTFLLALFFITSHLLPLPVTLAAPVAPVALLRRQLCYDVGGNCRIKVPAVADPIQLSSSPAAPTPSSTPPAEAQVAAVAPSSSGSDSAPASTPTPTTGSSSKNSNAGVALVSNGKPFFAAFAALAATALVF
ncbi:hypothetical protein BC827DRAFT_1217887 [Russula dissimulans]|nr:hypothetical protein BC827DRAFT_1217887 [Russula dissimulans]